MQSSNTFCMKVTQKERKEGLRDASIAELPHPRRGIPMLGKVNEYRSTLIHFS